MARPFILTAEVRVRANRGSVRRTAQEIKRGLAGATGGASVGGAAGGGSASGGSLVTGANRAASGANKAAAATNKWAKSLGSVSKQSQVTTRNISTMVRDVATLTGGLITLRAAMMAVGAGMKNALKFESLTLAMRQISGQDSKKLSKSLRQVSDDFNVSAEAIAKSVITLQQAGKGNAAIEASLETFAKMSKNSQIGAENLQSATNAIIVFENVFGKSLVNAERSMNQIIELSKTQYITADEIAASSTNLANSVKVLGLEYEDMLSILAATKHQTGQSANKVSMGLRTFLGRITTGRTSKKLSEDFGIEVFDEKDQFVGMVEVLDQLDNKLRDLGTGSAGAQELLQTLGGMRRKDIAAGALNSLPLILKNIQAVSGEVTDHLQNDFEEAEGTIGHALEGVKQQFLEIFRVVGEDGEFKALSIGILQVTEALLSMSTALGTVAAAGAGAGILSMMGGRAGSAAMMKNAFGGFRQGGTGARRDASGYWMPGKQSRWTPGRGMSQLARSGVGRAGAGVAGGMALAGAGMIDVGTSYGAGVGKAALSGVGAGLTTLAMTGNVAAAALAGLGTAALSAYSAFKEVAANRRDLRAAADRSSYKTMAELGVSALSSQYVGRAQIGMNTYNVAQKRAQQSATKFVSTSEYGGYDYFDTEQYAKHMTEAREDMADHLPKIMETFRTAIDKGLITNGGTGEQGLRGFKVGDVNIFDLMTKAIEKAGDGGKEAAQELKDLETKLNDVAEAAKQAAEVMVSYQMSALEKLNHAYKGAAGRVRMPQDPFTSRGRFQGMQENEVGTIGFSRAMRGLPFASGRDARSFETMNRAMGGIDRTQRAGITVREEAELPELQADLISALREQGVDGALATDLVQGLGKISAEAIASGAVFEQLRSQVEANLAPLAEWGAALDAQKAARDQLRVGAMGEMATARGYQLNARGIQENAIRRNIAMSGGQVNPLMADASVVSAAGGSGKQLGNQLKELRDKLSKTTDGHAILNERIAQTREKLQMLGDVTSRTADIMASIGRAQGSISSRASFRENMIMADPEQRMRMQRDYRSAEFAARTGKFNELGVEQQQSILRGLGSLGGTIFRGEGQFKGKTAQEIKGELLKTDADRRDEAEIKARKEQLHKIEEDAWNAWNALADDHKSAAQALNNAAQSIVNANNGQPQQPVGADPVGPNGQRIPPPGPAPQGPDRRGPAPRGGFANREEAAAAGREAREAAEKTMEAATLWGRVTSSFKPVLEMLGFKLEKHGDAVKAIPEKMQIQNAMVGDDWSQLENANQKRGRLEEMGLNTYQQRAAYMRHLKALQAKVDFDDKGPS
jgi:TP901 family phage tail tape measure protein